MHLCTVDSFATIGTCNLSVIVSATLLFPFPKDGWSPTALWQKLLVAAGNQHEVSPPFSVSIPIKVPSPGIVSSMQTVKCISVPTVKCPVAHCMHVKVYGWMREGISKTFTRWCLMPANLHLNGKGVSPVVCAVYLQCYAMYPRV